MPGVSPDYPAPVARGTQSAAVIPAAADRARATIRLPHSKGPSSR